MARFKLGKKSKRDDTTSSLLTMPLVMTEDYAYGGNGRHSVGQSPQGYVPGTAAGTVTLDQTLMAGSVGGPPSVMLDLHPHNAKFLSGHSRQHSRSLKPLPAGVTTPWKRFKLMNLPFPRYRHAASAVTSDKNEVFLMGGLKEGLVFGDTWKIVPHVSHHEIVGYEASPIEVALMQTPPARVGHASVLCGNAFIVYGGDTVDTDDAGFPDNNFYLFNINNNKYTVPGHILNKPNGRYGHTLAVVLLTNLLLRLYLFGGQLENLVYDDLYFFELNTFKLPKAKWELVEPQNNFKPPPLTNHSMLVYKNKLYVFGGVYNNEKVLNDLWCYDPSINKWMQVPTTGRNPPPTNEHSACVVGDRLFIYGGNDFSGIIYSLMYVLDLTNFSWQRVNTAGEVAGPGPRCGHLMTYVPRYHKLVVMGGDKNDYVNEDPHDFDVYDTITGNEVGTMLFELDVDFVDHFYGNDGLGDVTEANESPVDDAAPIHSPNVGSIVPVTSPKEHKLYARDIAPHSRDIIDPRDTAPHAGALGSPIAPPITDELAGNDSFGPSNDDTQGYANHAKLYSAGPEDFALAEALPMVKPVSAHSHVPPIPNTVGASSVDESSKLRNRRSLDPGKPDGLGYATNGEGAFGSKEVGGFPGAANSTGVVGNPSGKSEFSNDLSNQDYSVPKIPPSLDSYSSGFNESSNSKNLPSHQPVEHKSASVKSPAIADGIDGTAPLRVPDSRDDDPIANQNNALNRTITNDGGKLKALVADLLAQLNHLRSNTKVQMQQATQRISELENENKELRETSQQRTAEHAPPIPGSLPGVSAPSALDAEVAQLRQQIAEQKEVIDHLKLQVGPTDLDITSRDLNDSPGGDRSLITDVGRLKLERMEYRQKVAQLDADKTRLARQVEEYEPFMQNHVSDLSKFQQVIETQERQLAQLGQLLFDQNKLLAELDEMKTKHANLERDFATYRQIYPADDVDGTREIDDPSVSATNPRSLAAEMRNMVEVWTNHLADIKQRALEPTPAVDNSHLTQLQSQLDELMAVSKQNDEMASREINDLKALVEERLNGLRSFEEKYRDALSLVNHTSKALKLSQEEVQSQKLMLDKLMKENNELRMFKTASRRTLLRSATPMGTPGGPGATEGLPLVAPIAEDLDDEDVTRNTHANLKIKDLEADLFILGQERDSLKDQVVSLKKQLYMAQNDAP